jgi:hypothetical protein
VYFVWAGAFIWISELRVRIAIGVFCIGLFYVLTQTIFKVPIEASENSAYRRVAKGLRNPRRVRDALLRISFLTLSIMMSAPSLLLYLNFRVHIALLSYSLIVLTTVVLYLIACDPRPPCAGRVKEWLRGFAREGGVTGQAGTAQHLQPHCPGGAGPFGRSAAPRRAAGGPSGNDPSTWSMRAGARPPAAA